jgi:hypothetical protein
MSQQRNPVLLRSPSWDGWAMTEETEMVLLAHEYDVTFDGRLWRVHVKATGEWIYAGDGPVEVTDSPAPF